LKLIDHLKIITYRIETGNLFYLTPLISHYNYPEFGFEFGLGFGFASEIIYYHKTAIKEVG